MGPATKLRVLISAPYLIPELGRFRFLFDASGIEPVVPEVKERLSEAALMTFAGSIDGAICGDDPFTPSILQAAAPRLKAISKWGTGVDSIDRGEATRLGIQVFNTPGAFTEAVADSIMGYILAFARRIPWSDREMKAGEWVKLPTRALHECVLGVVGVGKIGKAVMRRGQAFGMTLLGNDIVPIDPAFLEETGVSMIPFEALLRRSDFVSLNCDLNPTSRGLIGRQAFSWMRSTTILVNTARGPVVDEETLVAALRSGGIAGAALDVFSEEPLPAASPLRSLDNVLLSPHNANSSPRAWERVHRTTIANLFRGLSIPLPAPPGEDWSGDLQGEGDR